MRGLLIGLVVMLIALPCAAQQLTIGPGGVSTYMSLADTDVDIGDLFAELEYQIPMNDSERQWLGVAPSLAGDSKTKGMAIRYYFETAGGAAYPGIGIGAYRIDKDDVTELTQATWFLGGELLFEFAIPMGAEADLPATAVIGLYPSVIGENDASIIRLGVKVAPDLLD